MIPGGHLDALTEQEARELLEGFFEKATEERVRAAASIQLDGTGSGEDEAYTPPMGFEFEARRVGFDLSTAPDVGGGVPLGSPPPASAQGTTAAAPPAFTIIASLGVLPKGVYNINVTGWQSGTPDANPTNIQLAGPLANTNLPSLATPESTNVRVVTDGVTGTFIKVGAAAGGAGAVYNVVAIATPIEGSGITVEYLRGVGGTRIEWAQPTYGSTLQVPGTQSWGDEQGPYVRNGETFAVRAKGLTANALLVVTVEGIQKRLPGPQGTAS